PFRAFASPSPVTLLTPELGAAATPSCPCSRSLLTSFDPMSPVPPITRIFMILLSFRPSHYHVRSRDEFHHEIQYFWDTPNRVNAHTTDVVSGGRFRHGILDLALDLQW